MKRVLTIVALLCVLATAAWWTTALAIAGPQPAWLRQAMSVGYAIGLLIVLWRVRPFIRALLISGAICSVPILWWNSISPSNNGAWQPDVARLPSVGIRGNMLDFHNIRNFDYRSETDFTPRYEDRTYNLARLQGLDLFMSYWGSPAIAHTILSWQFEGSPPLAITIETRKKIGQEYSTVDGFFRQYEIIYVAADERDIIRVRTNHRGEQVYLYRLTTPLPQARALLMDYVTTMNDLVAHPQFYNALTDNCTTSIRRHMTHLNPHAQPFDWRMLANGYADRLLYERGNVDRRLPFRELRNLSLIDAKGKAADQDPAFSERIREGLPDPRNAARGS